MKTHKYSLFLKPPSLYHEPHRLPAIICLNTCNRYPGVVHSCRQISPSHSSISPLLFYFKPRFRRTFLSSSLSLPSAALHAISVQSPCSHMCIGAPSTTVATQHQLYFGGANWSLALITVGTVSSWLPTFFTGSLKRLTLPFTHLLIYVPRDITEEESLWDTIILWPVSAYVHVKWTYRSSTGEAQT